VFPAARPGELRPAEALDLEKAWKRMLAGDAKGAEKVLGKPMAARPGLVPLETALAYARLRDGRVDPAAAGFDAALARRPEYVPALMGAGSVAVRRGSLDQALDLYRRAQAAEPDDGRARRRSAEVKLRVTEKSVAEARAATDAGDAPAAISAYQRALAAAPEVAGLRLSLAELLLAERGPDPAIALLAEDPSGDRQVRMRLAEILAGTGDYSRALAVLDEVLARDPRDPDALRRAREVREAATLLQLPEEYRRIPAAPRVSRAELAALLSIKVTGLARLPMGEPEVAVDIAGSWARTHIARLLALGILEVYPNHTFQPGAFVRRGELARACSRALGRMGAEVTPSPGPTDMAPTNLLYEDTVRAVGAGLLELNPAGAFEPAQFVSGREALDVVDALARRVSP
jgi:tetratricopeptide (TPR) repeat protein